MTQDEARGVVLVGFGAGVEDEELGEVGQDDEGGLGVPPVLDGLIAVLGVADVAGGFLGLGEKGGEMGAGTAEGVVGAERVAADVLTFFDDHVLFVDGTAGVVVHVPAQGLEERRDELRARLGFLVAVVGEGGALGVEVVAEGANGDVGGVEGGRGGVGRGGHGGAGNHGAGSVRAARLEADVRPGTPGRLRAFAPGATMEATGRRFAAVPGVNMADRHPDALARGIFFEAAASSPGVTRELGKLARRKDVARFSSVAETAQPFLVAVILEQVRASGGNVWVLCDTEREQERFHAELSVWVPAALLFPHLEIAAVEGAIPDAEIAAERLSVLQRVAAADEPAVVVINRNSFDEPCPRPPRCARRASSWNAGCPWTVRRWFEQLVEAGYTERRAGVATGRVFRAGRGDGRVFVATGVAVAHRNGSTTRSSRCANSTSISKRPCAPWNGRTCCSERRKRKQLTCAITARKRTSSSASKWLIRRLDATVTSAAGTGEDTAAVENYEDGVFPVPAGLQR